MTLLFLFGGGAMKEHLEKQIYKKIEKEYDDFISEMLKLSKEKIINNSYKIAVINEFKEFSINIDCNLVELEALSHEPNLLQTFYRNWLKYDDVSLSYVTEITINKITDRYMNILKEKLNKFSKLDLVKDICEVLNYLDDNNCDFIKEKFNVEEFSDEIVYLILKDRKGIKDLYYYLCEVVDIDYLADEKILKNNNVEEKILPKLKEEFKIKETIER